MRSLVIIGRRRLAAKGSGVRSLAPPPSASATSTQGSALGRLDDQQLHTLIGDIAATVRALVVLDARYATIPGWERLHRADRLGWAALACALDASLI